LRKLQKIIASVLCFFMLLSMTANISFASVSADVRDTKYETQAQVLGGLGIMVGDAGTGAFRPNDPIKRSEASKIAIALMGLFASAQSPQKSVFPDVAEDYWAKGFINSANAHGLVIGDDTGLFRPEDQIKFSEVCTILIRALGYEVQAKSKGGYPMGYVSVASNIGLSKGVSASADTLISRGDVAIMAYNALKINLMEQTGFGSNVKYEVTNKTLLKDKLDTELIQGKVLAVGSSVLDGKAALSKNEIRIGDKTYDAGKTDVRTILGLNADAYYSLKTKKLIAIVPTENANSIVNVDAESIEKIENTLSSKALYYYKNPETSSKTTKLILENDAVIVYNGKIAGNDKFDMIDMGYMSVLDNDSNGKYDIVFVSETQNYVVDEVFAKAGKISDKYGAPTLKLDFEDENKTVILEMAGERIDISDVKEWDVISFTISEDESIIFGDVIRNSIEGKITEIGSEYVYVGDKKFKVAKNYTSKFTTGDEGVFYLDAQGKIAGFNGELQKSANYAYLENMAIGTGLGQTLKFEIFTSKGEFETFEAAEKVTVNNSKNLSHEAAMKAIGGKGQLITFEKDASGKIKKIVTGKSSSDINEDEFTLNMDESDVIYRASSSKLTGSDMSISITGETVIFDIPEGKGKEDYAVRKKDMFSDGGLYDVKVFDVDESYKAGAVIVTNMKSKADEASSVAIVEKVNVSSNSKGETIHKLYAHSEGKVISLSSKNENVLKKEGGSLIGEGDIIQLRTNAEGEIDAITVLFDNSKEQAEAKVKHSDNLTTVYGKVVKKFSDSINVQVGSSKAENYVFAGSQVYVYDKALSKNKIKTGDTSDIERYDNDGGKIFMRIFKDEVKEIVVIK